MLKIVKHSAKMLTIGFLIVSLASAALAGCEYEIANVQYGTCDGQPIKEWVLTGVGAEFTDDCNVLVKGCVKLNVEITKLKIEFKGSKNKMEISRGKKDVCGMKLFDTTFNCPLPKDYHKCTTKDWVQKVPRAALPMAVGLIDGECKLKTNVGDFCYKVSADLKRK